MIDKKLLLVIDMQNDFITGSLGTPEAQEIVPKVVEKIQNWDGPVWFTMDTHNADYLNTPEGRKLPVKHCILNEEGWYLHPDVEETRQQLEAERRCSIWLKDTFWIPDPLELLISCKLWGVDRIEVVGLCTDVCVISNVIILKASDPFRNIAVDASCCAGTTPELHEAALKVMQSCQIDILNWKNSQG